MDWVIPRYLGESNLFTNLLISPRNLHTPILRNYLIYVLTTNCSYWLKVNYHSNRLTWNYDPKQIQKCSIVLSPKFLMWLVLGPVFKELLIFNIHDMFFIFLGFHFIGCYRNEVMQCIAFYICLHSCCMVHLYEFLFLYLPTGDF